MVLILQKTAGYAPTVSEADSTQSREDLLANAGGLRRHGEPGLTGSGVGVARGSLIETPNQAGAQRTKIMLQANHQGSAMILCAARVPTPARRMPATRWQ